MLSPVDYGERYWDRRAAAQLRCLPGGGETNAEGCFSMQRAVWRGLTRRETPVLQQIGRAHV